MSTEVKYDNAEILCTVLNRFKDAFDIGGNFNGVFNPSWNFEEFKETNKGVLIFGKDDFEEIISGIENEFKVTFEPNKYSTKTTFVNLANLVVCSLPADGANVPEKYLA